MHPALFKIMHMSWNYPQTPWPENPTNPVNSTSESPMQIFTNVLLSTLDSDQIFPEVTAFRQQL